MLPSVGFSPLSDLWPLIALLFRFIRHGISLRCCNYVRILPRPLLSPFDNRSLPCFHQHRFSWTHPQWGSRQQSFFGFIHQSTSLVGGLRPWLPTQVVRLCKIKQQLAFSG